MTALWSACALMVASAAIAVAASHSSPPQEMQSTMTGVYTSPQATRGEETYMALCVACHPAGTYKAVGFRQAWIGRPLSELFDQVREKMPKNDPASLSPGEYAQVVAYLLKINGVPAGESELPADSEVMKKIKIEMPAPDRHDNDIHEEDQ